MTTYTKNLLSGSVNGKAILVSGSASGGGVTVHTAASGSAVLDEIWLWAVNSSTSGVKLTMEWGETTAPNGNIESVIPGESGLYTVVPGLLLQNGLAVTAFSSTSNVINIHGFVNRIT